MGVGRNVLELRVLRMGSPLTASYIRRERQRGATSNVSADTCLVYHATFARERAHPGTCVSYHAAAHLCPDPPYVQRSSGGAYPPFASFLGRPAVRARMLLERDLPSRASRCGASVHIHTPKREIRMHTLSMRKANQYTRRPGGIARQGTPVRTVKPSS